MEPRDVAATAEVIAARSGWERFLLGLCALKLAVLIVVFDPSGLIAFDLPKSLASRALLWPMVAVLLILFIARGRAVFPGSPLHLAAAGVAVTWLVAAASAEDRFLALYGEDDRYLGLTYLADMIVLYLSCAVAVRDVRDASVLLAAIACGAVVSLAYGAAQAIGADPFWWQDAPADRPFSTFGNPDHFGHFLSVVFGLSLGALVGARGRLGVLAGVAGVAAALAAASLVATRGTAIGTVAGTIIAPLVPGIRKRALGAAALIALVLAVILGTTPLGERVRATLGGGQMQDRAVVYAASLGAFGARPITGYGPDNFRIAYARHRAPPARVAAAATPQSSAHNWIFDAAVMTGALGLFALLMLVGLGTRELFALSRRAPNVGVPFLLGWCAYWAHALVAVGSIAIGWLPWVALGVAVGLRSGSLPRRVWRSPGWLAAILIVGAVIGSTTGARSFLANRDALVMEHSSAIDDAQTALLAAENAVARDPGRAENWNRLGIALDGLDLRSMSRDAYREAADRRPYEPIYWANVARSEAHLALAGDAGARDAAITAARRAIDADANSLVGHAVMVEIAVALGRCELARMESDLVTAFGRGDLAQLAETCR